MDSTFKRVDNSSGNAGNGNKLESPSRTMLAAGCSCKKASAAAIAISGPIPAGSPEVIARLTGAGCRIICINDLHRSGITQFA